MPTCTLKWSVDTDHYFSSSLFICSFIHSLLIFILSEPDLKSFCQLQHQFALLTSDFFFRYFQIRHYIISHNEMVSGNPNEIENYFDNVVEKHFPDKRHVSNRYKKLTSGSDQTTLHIKEKWGLELDVTAEDDVWEELCAGCLKGDQQAI